MARKIRVLFLAVIMLVICVSSTLAAVVDENGTRGIQINLNMTNQAFRLDGVAPKDDKGMYLVNGFHVYPPQDQDDEYYLTANILTNVANAMYVREQWPSLKQKYFSISDDSCLYGKGDNVVDFSKSGYQSYKGQQLLLPAVPKSDLSGYTFEVEGQGNELAFHVTKVIERASLSDRIDRMPIVSQVPCPDCPDYPDYPDYPGPASGTDLQ